MDSAHTTHTTLTIIRLLPAKQYQQGSCLATEFRYYVVVPEEMHDKVRLAIAENKVDARWLQGYMRFFLRKLLETRGVRFTKDYGNKFTRAMMVEDGETTEKLIESFLVRNNRERGPAERDTLEAGNPGLGGGDAHG